MHLCACTAVHPAMLHQYSAGERGGHRCVHAASVPMRCLSLIHAHELAAANRCSVHPPSHPYTCAPVPAHPPAHIHPHASTHLGFRKNSCCCSSVSAPTRRWMIYSWSMSLSPGNSGWPSTSSPMMHLQKRQCRSVQPSTGMQSITCTVIPRCSALQLPFML